MKCHYEVLNVSRDADEGEIKTSYKKLALKWHPDKNLDDTEYAKEQFQMVQQAYEVLSDRQERTWYDSHREQILWGSNAHYQDKNLNVYQYFTTTCFKGYSDDENSFYTVYRKVFEQIAKEDIEYMDDKDEFCNIPMFGNSNSDYNEHVRPFYDYWLSYATKKSYVWLDPHDIKEAINRKVFKLIEKENDKIRQKARKERNEEVRNLVAFIRKRDKRVQLNTKLQEAKKVENRRKQEQLAKQKRMERIQLNKSSEQAEWMKFDNVKSELEEIEKKLAQEFGDLMSQSEEECSDEESDNLYCVVCNKLFKTPKAFTNHELSKKHRDNITKLKKSMREDELDDDGNISTGEESIKDVSIEVDSALESEEEVKDTQPKKKNKKSKKILKVNDVSDSETTGLDHIEPAKPDNDSSSETKNQKRKKKKEKEKIEVVNVDVTDTSDVKDQDDLDVPITSNKKKSNKTNKKLNKKVKSQDGEVDKDHSCVTCRANFSSKNKLFDHLKKTGHSVQLRAGTGNVEKQQKKLVRDKL